MKTRRQEYILEQLEKRNFVKITELKDELNVTEMTIRRDLAELAKDNLLIKVHGGAQCIPAKETEPASQPSILTLEHDDRRSRNTEKKELIARKAASLVRDGEILFISASTTNEFIAKYLTAKNVKVITNCLYIFFLFHKLPNVEAILIGGKYNEFIQSFLGPTTLDGLKNITFTKAFVGTNAIKYNKLYASNDEEGLLHKTVLNNARERYVVCDTTKFNTDAFYNFYNCEDLTAVITDSGDIDNILEYRELTSIV